MDRSRGPSTHLQTTAALNHLQRDALRTPHSRYAYIAPTYKQAKNIAWDLIKQFSNVIPGIEYNEAELTVKYPNGSKLTLYGADNPFPTWGWVRRKCAYWLDAIAQYRQVWDDKRGMFLEKPYHDWTSHAADEYPLAAVVEDQMTNSAPPRRRKPPPGLCNRSIPGTSGIGALVIIGILNQI